MSDAIESTGPISQQETAKLLRLATYASTSVAIFLIGAKLIAWGASDSVSLLATLIDSMLDALASIINLAYCLGMFPPANGRMGDNVITDYNAGEGDQIALFGAGFVREDTQVGDDVVITVDDSSGNLLGTITVLDTLLIDL